MTPEDTWPKLHLADCDALQVLSIFVPMDDDPFLPHAALDYVPYWESVVVLTGTLPPGLRELRVGIELTDPDFLEELFDEVAWERVDQLFARHPQMRVSFYQDDRHEERLQKKLLRWVRRYLSDSLPRAVEDGRLNFVPPKDEE